MNIKKQKLSLINIKKQIVSFLDDLLSDLRLYRKIRGGVWYMYEDIVVANNDCYTYCEWVCDENLKAYKFSDFFQRVILKIENYNKV